MNDHEENINREFEEREKSVNSNNKSDKITNLGKVENPGHFNKPKADDPEIKKLNDIAGYVKLKLQNLPSQGRFYRDDFEIHIRPASVREIRDFSTMDEESVKDVDDKLNNIIVSCTKIMYGNQRGSYKDILEEDRIYVLLEIKQLTFKEGENKLMMPVTAKKCPSSQCEAQKNVELNTEHLQTQEHNETLEKYYDSVNKCYAIQTKNFGVINMAPPTIGVMRALSEWVRDKAQKGEPYDESLITILPYLQREWRGWGEKEIFASITNLIGYNDKKFTLIYRLAERMKIGIKPEMKFPCESCGAEVTVPLTFPGGIKALFIISDISSELL